MRIAFIVAVFPPEPEPAALMADELTHSWALAGHQVSVICPSPNRPSGSRYPGYLLWETSTSEGRTTSRVWSWLIGPERRSINRILENITFGFSSALKLAVVPKPDVAVVESWPILAYLPVVAVAAARGIPLLNYIQDVYPEAGISGGQIKEGSLVARVLIAADRFVCSRAAANIVVGSCMRDLLVSRRDLPSDRFFILENWLDVDRIRPVSSVKWRREVGIGEEQFVGLFAGTMGYASGVDVLSEVAVLLRDQPGVRLVCVGEGVLRKPMAEAVARHELKNLTLLPFQPRERLSEVQSAADVAILTTAPRMGSSSVPSKLITYLAAGRPVICAADAESDVARLVREEGVGEVVPPGAPEALAAAILRMRDLPAGERLVLGLRAREVAERRFSVGAAVGRFAQLFTELGLTSKARE